MMFKSESSKAILITPQASLVACCEIVAEKSDLPQLAGWLSQAVDVSGGTGRKETLEKIGITARAQGVRTSIHRLQPDEIAELVPLLPAVVEMRDKGYWVVDTVEEVQPSVSERNGPALSEEEGFSVGVIIPNMAEVPESRVIKSRQFS